MTIEPNFSARIFKEDSLEVKFWYAVYTRSRHEQVVHNQLVAKNIESFLPKIEMWSKRKDRRMRVKIPMFPSYLFVRTTLHPDNHLGVLKTVGVVNIVTHEGFPARVNSDEINSLKLLIKSGRVTHPAESFSIGDLVKITDGPFKGVIGRLVGCKKIRRLIVQVQIINRAVSVEVDDNMIIKFETH